MSFISAFGYLCSHSSVFLVKRWVFGLGRSPGSNKPVWEFQLKLHPDRTGHNEPAWRGRLTTFDKDDVRDEDLSINRPVDASAEA